MPAPTNDNFANRQVLAPITGVQAVPFDLRGSTLESGEQHTAGMAGSVWFQVTVATDRWVLFEVPHNVEVRIYRGTATLSGMLFRAVSNDTARQGFNMGSAFTYFVKLQANTAVFAGTMHIRPFAWTDWITPEPIPQFPGQSKRTRIGRTIQDPGGAYPSAGFDTAAEAWAFTLEGPDDPDDYAVITGGATLTLQLQRDATGGNGWLAVYYEIIWSAEFAGPYGPLSSDHNNWPNDPTSFDHTLSPGLDYSADPVSGDRIQWDSGTSSLVPGALGVVQFTGGGAGLTTAAEDHDEEFYVNPVSPPSTYDAVPAWTTPPTSGITDPVVLHYRTAGPSRSVSGGTSAAPAGELPYDTAAMLSGTRLALSVAASAVIPDITIAGDGSAGLVFQVTNLVIYAKIPVQYPRYRMYAPLEVAYPEPAEGDIYCACGNDLYRFTSTGELVVDADIKQDADYLYLDTYHDQIAYDGDKLYVAIGQELVSYDPASLAHLATTDALLYVHWNVHGDYGAGLVTLSDKRMVTESLYDGSFLKLVGEVGTEDDDYVHDSGNGPLGACGSKVVTVGPDNGSPLTVMLYQGGVRTFLALEVPASQVTLLYQFVIAIVPYAGGYWASWERQGGPDQFLITRHDLSGAIVHTWYASDIVALNPAIYPAFVKAMDITAAGDLLFWTTGSNVSGPSSTFIAKLKLDDTAEILVPDIYALTGRYDNGEDTFGTLHVVRGFGKPAGWSVGRPQ